MAKEHAHAVQRIVLSGYLEWFSDAVPVERRAKNRLQKVAVWIIIRPLALTLEARNDRIVAERFLAETGFGEAGVTNHQVTNDEGTFNHELPFVFLFLPRARF